jgi:hypothetical protein
MFLPSIAALILTLILVLPATAIEDIDEKTHRVNLVESFASRKELLASGNLSLALSEWALSPPVIEAGVQKQKPISYETLTRIIEWFASVPITVESDTEKQKYLEAFHTFMFNQNMERLSQQNITYWYDHSSEQVLQRISRSGLTGYAEPGDAISDEWLYFGGCLIRYVPHANRVHVSRPENQYMLPYYQIHEIDPVFIDFSPIIECWPMGQHARIRKTSDTVLALETEDQAKSVSLFKKKADQYLVYDTRGEAQGGTYKLYHAQRLYEKPDAGDPGGLLPRLSVKIDAGPDFINVRLCWIDRHEIGTLDEFNYYIYTTSEPEIRYESEETKDACGPIIGFLREHGEVQREYQEPR